MKINKSIVISLLFVIFTCLSSFASSFYYIPIYPQSKVVDKNDSKYLASASIVSVTNDSETEVKNYYIQKLGKPTIVEKASYRTVLNLKRMGKNR